MKTKTTILILISGIILDIVSTIIGIFYFGLIETNPLSLKIILPLNIAALIFFSIHLKINIELYPIVKYSILIVGISRWFVAISNFILIFLN
jgi:hypothetical protein